MKGSRTAAAKIAVITSHTAALRHLTRHGDVSLRLPCPAFRIRCSGPPVSLFGTPKNLPSLCPNCEKPRRAAAERKEFPVSREFSARLTSGGAARDQFQIAAGFVGQHGGQPGGQQHAG